MIRRGSCRCKHPSSLAETIQSIGLDPNGHTVFKQPLEYLPDNISLGRSPDDLETWLYFPMATPGSANTTAGFAEISGAASLKSEYLD